MLELDKNNRPKRQRENENTASKCKNQKYVLHNKLERFWQFFILKLIKEDFVKNIINEDIDLNFKTSNNQENSNNTSFIHSFIQFFVCSFVRSFI